jgi:hypothetical protein
MCIPSWPLSPAGSAVGPFLNWKTSLSVISCMFFAGNGWVGLGCLRSTVCSGSGSTDCVRAVWTPWCWSSRPPLSNGTVLAEHYAAFGVDGFRCDAAYKVPGELWRTLIGTVKHHRPGVTFFAESLGCPIEDTVRLAQSGFDFIFNSSKWWDFTAPWCLEQYRQTAPLVPSVSFPESHDTGRLAVELNGDQAAVKMRYAFSALFSAGVMMPIGFEYGFRRLWLLKTLNAAKSLEFCDSWP